jgi:hypothetical protein
VGCEPLGRLKAVGKAHTDRVAAVIQYPRYPLSSDP